MKVLKLGTRRSLLAWAQSSWVARELEKRNPGIQVELVGIETQGDKIVDIPLRKVEGKEFFVAEVDEALRSKRVDLTVHSMKDLSLDRPPELVCGAMPKRENPRDIIIFSPEAQKRIAAGEEILIGTSSPRRIENIPPFLQSALPRNQAGHEHQLKLLEIRGNVNTRLSRLHEPLHSDRYLDGVVLAFAGLIRLWADSKGQEELKRWLSGVRWMVLPLRECPTAPAQGTLSVECRTDDQEVRAILAKLHDPDTAKKVAQERQVLADWGGGCHQRFGASAADVPQFQNLMFIRGARSNGTPVDEVRWTSPVQETRAESQEVWDGAKWRENGIQADQSLAGQIDGAAPVFVAHSRAVPKHEAQLLRSSRIWTSGTGSWFRLAAQGLWVEGCFEGFGFQIMQFLISEKVLGLPQVSDWVALTHSLATADWENSDLKVKKVISTYRVDPQYSAECRSALSRATQVYWASGSQFEELNKYSRKDAVWASGPGKTAQGIQKFCNKSGRKFHVFPSINEWRKWINQA